MKKIALILAVISIFVIKFSLIACAVELPLRVIINSTKLTFPDVQPFIDSNGRTQTPARFIGEALGARVTWDDIKQEAVFVSGNQKLVLYIGKKEYDLNGKKNQMDTAALLKEGRTFVPARYIAEAFGGAVKWDSAVRTVYISTVKDNKPEDGTIVEKNGFYIPNNSEVLIVKSSDTGKYQTEISISFLYDDYEKQVEDLKYALNRKFGKDISEQVINYIRLKKSRWDKLEEKNIYVSTTNQYIKIRASYAAEISVLICVPGYKPQ